MQNDNYFLKVLIRNFRCVSIYKIKLFLLFFERIFIYISMLEHYVYSKKNYDYCLDQSSNTQEIYQKTSKDTISPMRSWIHIIYSFYCFTYGFL